jgi:nucleoside-diphosphate kinase
LRDSGNTGKIIDRIIGAGFTIRAMKWTQLSRQESEKFYAIHKERPFFGELVDFITCGPVFAMVWEGENVISTARLMMGATNPKDSAPGTVRGDFAVTVGKNIIHGSDSP